MSKLHEIRPATIHDVPTMAQIIAAGNRQSCGELPPWLDEQLIQGPTSPEGLARLRGQVIIAQAIPENRRLWVAQKAGNKVVGLLVARRVDHVQLGGLFVESREQRRGVGGALLDTFSQWAGPELPQQLDVLVDNDPAISLYKEHGFAVVPGTEETYPPLTYVIMQKQPTGGER